MGFLRRAALSAGHRLHGQHVSGTAVLFLFISLNFRMSKRYIVQYTIVLLGRGLYTVFLVSYHVRWNSALNLSKDSVLNLPKDSELNRSEDSVLNLSTKDSVLNPNRAS